MGKTTSSWSTRWCFFWRKRLDLNWEIQRKRLQDSKKVREKTRTHLDAAPQKIFRSLMRGALIEGKWRSCRKIPIHLLFSSCFLYRKRNKIEIKIRNKIPGCIYKKNCSILQFCFIFLYSQRLLLPLFHAI